MNMTVRQAKLLNGLLLGKGVIRKDLRKVRRRGISREYAEWLKEEFDDLGGRIYGDDTFVISTDGEWIENWRNRWYYRNVKIVPVHLSLTPEMAGVWYHDRGSTESHGRLKISLDGMENSIQNALNLLNRSGFDAFRSFGDIYMRERERREFLDWIEEPEFCSSD